MLHEIEADAAVVEGVLRYLTPDVTAQVIKSLRAILKMRSADLPAETKRIQLRRANARI